MGRSVGRFLRMTAILGLALVGCAPNPAIPTSVPSGAGVQSTDAEGTRQPAGVPSDTTGEQAAPSAVTCDYVRSGNPAKPVDPPDSRNVPARGTLSFTLQMSAGPVTIMMDRADAPCAVRSFESLAQQGFFNHTTCHRLVDTGIFILQCGDPTGTGMGGPGYRFDDELTGKETYPRGTVAMANSGPNTNGSQFFLVYADSALDPRYTVLGHMDETSTAVIAGIAARGVNMTASPHPIADATIESVSAG